MFIALLNINSIFMLIILFLVARNVVKLIMERRRKVFGAQIRNRLVVVFVSLSLIPTVIMFLASNRVVATSVDYWFTRQTETSLQAALDVGQSFYAAAAERLHSRSEAIAQEAAQRRIAWTASSANTLLRPYPGRLCHAAGEGTVLARPQSLYRGMAGSTHANRLDPCGQGDLRLLALGNG